MNPDSALITVGIVDDHRVFAMGLAAWLRNHTDVIDVAIVEPTWAEFVSHPAYPTRVVILDLDLADDIPPTVKIGTAAAAGAAVVVVSAMATSQLVRACLDAGARGYVPKTEAAEDVVQAVFMAAAGDVYLSPALAAVLLSDDRGGPVLSDQEARVLALYASGLPLKSVARQLNIGYESAKTYLDRVRDKYADSGRDARTKIDLRRRAVEDGHVISSG